VTVITSLLSGFPDLRRSVTVAAHSLQAAISVAMHMIYPLVVPVGEVGTPAEFVALTVDN